MPQSLAQVYLHLVFSTKDRVPFLSNKQMQQEMHKYLGATANNLDCRAYESEESLIMSTFCAILVEQSRSRNW